MTELQTFERLVQLLKIDELPEEEQEQFLLELNDVVYEGALTRLYDRIDEKTADELTALFENDATEEEVEAFLEKVPEAGEALEETVQDIAEDVRLSLALV